MFKDKYIFKRQTLTIYLENISENGFNCASDS